MIVSGDVLTLGRMFEENAERRRDDVAVVCGDESRTNGELFRNGCRLAAALEDLGMRKQDRMAVLSMNNIAFVEAYVAGWTAGYVVGTVNFRLALPEVIWILNDIAPRVLLIEGQYGPHIAAIREAVPSIMAVIAMDGEVDGALAYADVLANAPADMPSTRATEDDVACLIYTSGTTGRPKGCIMGQRENAFNLLVLALSMGCVPGDRFLCVMPLFHIGAMVVGLTVLANGGKIVIHRQFDPAGVVQSLANDRITHALLAPTMVQMVLDQPDIASHTYPDLRAIFYSAAPMPSNVLRRGMELLGKVFLQMMGSSEGSSTTWLSIDMHRPDGTPAERRRLQSIGTPYRTVGVRIVDESGQDCPPEVPGEMILKSPVMFRGYWNNTAATLDAIRDGWFYSGDIGIMDEDGYIYLVDRKKDMIISGGENIYSREVEEALLQHPAVSQAAVIGCPDEQWGEIVCAVVVPVAGAVTNAEELAAHCQTLIASYKKPRKVVFVEELPRMVSGKVDKKALRADHGARA
jgi:acyl-CoA synthetase (AMP-forming)/AMP-acid ligase II